MRQLEISDPIIADANSLAFRESMATLGATRGFFLTPSGETFPLSEFVTTTSLAAFLSRCRLTIVRAEMGGREI